MIGMEAAAVSAAVSATLKLVCNKLAPLVIKEYSSIVGVEKDLQELQDLALEINQRLEAAGDRAMGDSLSFKKLKEAVYKVDDAVDEFQLKAEKYEAKVLCPNTCTQNQNHLYFNARLPKRSRKLRRCLMSL
jgi:hypothetical protein